MYNVVDHFHNLMVVIDHLHHWINQSHHLCNNFVETTGTMRKHCCGHNYVGEAFHWNLLHKQTHSNPHKLKRLCVPPTLFSKHSIILSQNYKLAC